VIPDRPAPTHRWKRSKYYVLLLEYYSMIRAEYYCTTLVLYIPYGCSETSSSRDLPRAPQSSHRQMPHPAGSNSKPRKTTESVESVDSRSTISTLPYLFLASQRCPTVVKRRLIPQISATLQESDRIGGSPGSQRLGTPEYACKGVCRPFEEQGRRLSTSFSPSAVHMGCWRMEMRGEGPP